VKLTIRRNGFQPLDVEFTVSPSQDSIVLDLQPLPSMTTPRQDNGRDVPMSMLFAFPFGRLFGRRRDRGNGNREPGGTQTLTFFNPDRGDEMPVIDHAVRSDPGCVRDINEDSIAIVAPNGNGERGHLAVVADGMGGHLGGEIASRLAVESVVEDYASDGADPREVLARAVRRANRRIFDAASKDPLLNGMGTTCTVLVIRKGLAYCAHVGDSRLYLVRQAQVLQMTEDHSTVMDLVRRGVLTRAEAKHHPERNVILRALGSRRDVDVAVWPEPFAVRPGDRFLLCSDGLHDLIEDDELLARVLDADPDAACERLITLARERGAPDNVSVALLAVRGPAAEQPHPATGSTPIAKLMKETRASEENEQ
jgi:protein phosphatase